MTSQYTVHRQAMVLCRQQLQTTKRTLEDAFSAYTIIRLRCATIQAHLKVERFKLLETAGTVCCNQRPISANAHDKSTRRTAFEQPPDARVNKRFADAKMTQEDLHIRHLIDKY